ncbi:MAG: DUF559 domain-containing protein [Clostridia bacterium]|nr:DUF559 domain-containing protein [Clostridia bacterium]MBQ8332633.1 DUF559 domain-containing protein [Clostridia bacterium]MBQ8370576.1 DUF559 domain-containing protein [Clostridia bacterium]
MKKTEKLTENAQELRSRMTPEEKRLWYDFLKKLPVSVHRQHVIGGYIVDFYIASQKIVIELDGNQHLTPEHKASDEKRDRELGGIGIMVLRYANRSVRSDFFGVTADILRHLGLTWEDLRD